MLEELKKQVVKYALQAEKSGLCRQRTGNFSVRDKESGHICITPTGVGREELSYHDIVVINRQAQVIEAKTEVKPTSEALMHLAAYASRSDIQAVAHTHSKFATVLAVLRKPLPAIIYEITELGCRKGYVPVADYGRPGTQELANSVKGPLQLSDAVLLESHGVLTVGADLKEAVLKAEYVEELAEMYYYAVRLNGGKEPQLVPLQELSNWEYPKEIHMQL